MSLTTPSLSSPLLEPNTTSTPVSSSTQLEVSNSSVDLEESLEDRDEQHEIERFISKGCGCKFVPKNTQCSEFVTKEVIVTSRQACMELTKDELDLIVLSNIRAHQALDGQVTLRSSHHEISGLSEILRCQYYIHGVRICRKMFLFLHCMSHFRYDNLVRHFKQHGLCTRTHGNFKRTPVNTIPFEEVSRVTSFISNFAEGHSMPLPGRVPGHRDKVVVLPSDITKQFVFTKYKDACATNTWTAVGKSKFYSLWQECLPHISISQPSSDLCYVCHSNSMAIQKAGFLPEEEKLKVYKTACSRPH